MSAAHPGKIVFVDAAGERVMAVGEVPATVAFVQVGGAPVPVVRVVAVTQGDRREIKSYGVDRALLSTTYQQLRA